MNAATVNGQADRLESNASQLTADIFAAAKEATVQPQHIYRAVIDAAERGMLQMMMRQTYGNQSKAAGLMGINRATLRVKLKRHGLL